MDASPFLVAESFVARRTEVVRRPLETDMAKRLDDAERGLVEMLERSIEAQKAALPFGQGEHLDVTV